MAKPADPALPIFAASISQAATMISVRPGAIRQLLAEGVPGCVHIGMALRIPVAALEALVAPRSWPPIIVGTCEEDPDDGGV
jgi:hypothetical protein